MARAKKVVGGEPGQVLLTTRQRELLALFAMRDDGFVRYMRDDHVPDWAQVKKVFVALGAEWKTRAKGFLFPPGVDGEGVLELALQTGRIVDPKVVGFFPTPDPLADMVVEMMNPSRASLLGRKLRVLEPSAGKGSLIRALARWMPNECEVDYCELLPENQAELLLSCQGASFKAADFLGWLPPAPYDAVLMNPPFSSKDDARHVLHAWNHALRPGGRLAAIMSAGVLYRDDTLTKVVRELILQNGRFVSLPADAFKESGTAVATVVALADKPIPEWLR